MATFESLSVRVRTCTSLEQAGFRDANPIQQQSIPPLLRGSDCVVEAPTGSGKTLAFAIPLIEKLAGHQGHGARALIVVPTRELATQVAEVISAVDHALRVVVCVGGVGYNKQTGGLRNSPDVIVACPGRLLDLSAMHIARFDKIEYLVLDEADEMLDQGFARDVEKIMAMCPQGAARQTVLVSATIPSWVQTMVAKHLQQPVWIKGDQEQKPLVEHGTFRVDKIAKTDTLSTLLKRQRSTDLNQTIVFHRTKHGVKKLARDLTRLGHRTAELQGNLSQNARDRALDSVRNGQADVLVATNVAARGIDVTNIGLVVNYELPDTPQWLTHRVGRTARNGSEGKAITFVSPEDGEQWRKLRKLGAPELQSWDTQKLLDAGQWHLGAPEPIVAGMGPAPGRRIPQSGGWNRPRPARGRRPQSA